MSADECIIFAFSRIGEPADSAAGTLGTEKVSASGEQFMGISLMTDIPHDAVAGRIEHVVQRHDDFHSAHA